MSSELSDTFWPHFSNIIDPRQNTHNKRHELKDILLLALLAVICGAESWVEVEEFGLAKISWLEKILSLPHGIPSHDTIGRVFSLISPTQFRESFLSWTKSLVALTDGEFIAIDGKTLRRSHDRAKDKKAIHMVSAWASVNSLVLSQVKTDEKSNEITAIPELLDLLCLKGCVVTIDAMGCQKVIAEKIVEQSGDYVLALKDNHQKLRKAVSDYLDDKATCSSGSLSYHETQDKGHGRFEIRRYWLTDQIDWLEQKAEWTKLRSIGLVEAERHIDGKVTIERRYYLCSLDNDVQRFSQSIRSHWGVENRLHWCLDVAFNEDQCRVRKDHAAENFAILRHIVLNMLRRETSTKKGLKAKRRKAGWNKSYLTKILDINGF